MSSTEYNAIQNNNIEDKTEEKKIKYQRDCFLKQILTEKALSRLSNIKLIRPELAHSVENQLIQLVNNGKITEIITDNILKQILIQLNSKKREIKIERK